MPLASSFVLLLCIVFLLLGGAVTIGRRGAKGGSWSVRKLKTKSIRIRTILIRCTYIQGMETEKRRGLIGTQEEGRQDPIWNGVT